MKNSPVDEFIISATKDLKNEIAKLKKENIPFVFLDGLIPLVDANYVKLDNYNGVVQLTKHLINNGYSKVGFVTTNSEMSQMIDRKKGVYDTLISEPAPKIHIPEHEKF